MKTIAIKRTTSDLPMMLLVAITFLFPGFYIMSQYRITSIAFILAALFTVFIVVVAAFAFVVIFKRHVFFILTKDGLESSGKFCRWDDIGSYRMETETEQYYSNEMNSNQERKTHSIVLDLKDGSSMRISADKLSKRPAEIIALFDRYSILPSV
ncbi:hypothetical protein GFS24_25030 [Chitinophaga sp. SYP-B3965]|uniref:hypothetical protein n=1 Tax=Chitinophaga sp. SYP-B3965 TaxID=2663120 RepID=UPI001299C086|nr:hypothetical protein [Chitinophaga sp. SYP-B3965]MRG48403.1 hypothetical protein [Chitinophaga sp. SYP-B3965]